MHYSCMKNTHVIDVLDRWASGINTAEYSSVVAMYAEEASLLPTFSSQACHSTTDIQNYFTGVSKNDKVTVSFDQESLQFESLSEDCSLVTGLYDWVIISDGVSKEVHARFSFVINASDKSPITHQHSSVVPA